MNSWVRYEVHKVLHEICILLLVSKVDPHDEVRALSNVPVFECLVFDYSRDYIWRVSKLYAIE